MTLAEKYLRELQQQIYVREGPWTKERDLEEMVSSMRKRAEVFAKDIPRYKITIEAHIEEYAKAYRDGLIHPRSGADLALTFQRYFEEISKVRKIGEHIYGSDKRPLTIGVLPTNSLNAYAIRVPNSDEYIVAFNAGLACYLNRLSKIVMSIFLEIDPTAVESIEVFADGWVEEYTFLVDRAIEKRKDILIRFLNLMVGLLFFNSANIGPPHTPSGFVRELSGLLLVGAELFICGHEVGHVDLGHFAREIDTIIVNIEGCEVEVVKLPPRMEFDADLFGGDVLTSVLEMQGSFDKNLRRAVFEVCSIPFFFKSAEIYQNCMPLPPECEGNEDSHPSPSERYVKAIMANDHYVISRFGESARSFFYSQTYMIDIVIERLFEKFAEFYMNR